MNGFSSSESPVQGLSHLCLGSGAATRGRRRVPRLGHERKHKHETGRSDTAQKQEHDSVAEHVRNKHSRHEIRRSQTSHAEKHRQVSAVKVWSLNGAANTNLPSWQTEGNLPWAERLRCGRTTRAARLAGLPDVQRTLTGA